MSGGRAGTGTPVGRARPPGPAGYGEAGEKGCARGGAGRRGHAHRRLRLRPAPRALADLAGAGALHSEARGGAGPPHTAALRHESPTLPGTLGQGRGAHSLYLAGLDLILPRGGLQSLPSPHRSPSLVPPSGLEGGAPPFSSLRPCRPLPLSSVLSLSLLVSPLPSRGRLFSLCLPLFLFLVLFFLVYFFVQCLCLPIPCPHHLPGRSH